MFHLLYISCISITLLFLLSPSHGVLGTACNIIFVFLFLALSRCIVRVIGFSRLNLCVWSMGFCYSQVSQTYLRICFSVTSLFHQLCFHSWIFVGKMRFCVPNRQLTRDSKSLFRSSMLVQEVFSFLLLSAWSLKTVNYYLKRFCVEKKNLFESALKKEKQRVQQASNLSLVTARMHLGM